MTIADKKVIDSTSPFLLYLEWAARREALTFMISNLQARLKNRRLRNPIKRLAARTLIDVLIGFKARTEQDINKLMHHLDAGGRTL